MRWGLSIHLAQRASGSAELRGFYEAACQITHNARESECCSGHTSGDRGQGPQAAKECARERRSIWHGVKLSSSRYDNEVTHPFIRARLGHGPCRRTGRSEGGAAPSSGRLSRAAIINARLLLQLDDLIDHTCTTVRVSVVPVATFDDRRLRVRVG